MLNNQTNILNKAKLVIATVAIVMLTACETPVPADGTNINTIALPTDTALTLHCTTMGINQDTCVLYDPNNPYANVNVTDDTKWDLNTAAPSSKAKVYLWATALARSPTGENQYYTADAFNRLYTASGDTAIKAQAIKAYRSVLDNYFGTITYFLASWSSQPDVYYAQSLADLVGDNLSSPGAGLSQLFADQASAWAAMSSWGYFYDSDTGKMSKNQ